MVKVHFGKLDPEDDVERQDTWLNGDTRAVLSDPYDDLDEGQGGLTFSDLRPSDIKKLSGLRAPVRPCSSSRTTPRTFSTTRTR